MESELDTINFNATAMDIQAVGSIRILGSDNQTSSAGCRAFYKEGEQRLYYINKKDGISLPGYTREFAYDYFYDLFVREAMRDLINYFQEHANDFGFYRTEQFWQDALKYAGRPIVPERVMICPKPKEGMVRFIQSIMLEQHSETECHYDLEAGHFVLTNKKGGEPSSLAQFFYGDKVLVQMLAQRQHERNMAPPPYGELCRINEYLADKRTVLAFFGNGKQLKSYHRSNLHAGDLLKEKDGEIITYCYNFAGVLSEESGLPLKLSHRNSELEIDIVTLRSLEVDLTEGQIKTKQIASLRNDLVEMLKQNESYSFSHVSLHNGFGENIGFFTTVTGITKEGLPDMPEADQFFRRNFTCKKVSATVESITLGSGEDTAPSPDMMELVRILGEYQLHQAPGYSCNYDFLDYSEEELLGRYIGEKDLTRDMETKLITSKIKNSVPSGFEYTFCDVTVNMPFESKQVLLPGHLSSEKEVAMVSILRRLRFRYQNISEFTVVVRNGVIGRGKQSAIDDELLNLIRKFGGCDCVEEIGGRLDSETYHIDADDIPLDDFKQRRLDRIARFRERASSAQERSDDLVNRAFKMVEHIPPGQPILVGHHSEARHRRDLDKSWNTMGKGVEERDKAGYYADKAYSSESNSAISSDDPDALDDLKDRLEELESKQELMKVVNKYYRDNGTCKGCSGVSDDLAAELDHDVEAGYNLGKRPYPTFELTNNSANIRRIKGRLEGLQKLKDNPIAGWEFEGGKVVANTDINRLQIFFDEIPEKEYRKRLKHEWSFNFSRFNDNAWQRQLNWNAVRAAKNAIKVFSEGRLTTK